ncbi:MAG: hypothetical protein ACJ75J_16135 [Cytophagaceae bacterium]
MKNIIFATGIMAIFLTSCGTTRESADVMPEQGSINPGSRYHYFPNGSDTISASQGIMSSKTVTSNKAGRR